MTWRRAALVLALSAALVGEALAQSKPAAAPAAPLIALTPAQDSPGDGESVVVEALEITARPRGPAMWTVTRGGSQVTILGTYNPLPHSLVWNDVRLRRALDGASALYLPQASIGLISGAGIVLTMGSLKLADGGRLEPTIRPRRMQHVREIAIRSHVDPESLQPFKPGVVGYNLFGSFVRAAGLSLEKPGTTVERLAKSLGVPVRPLAKVSVASLIRSVEKLDPPRQLACLDAYLARTDAVSDHGPAAADAWANGRLHELRGLAAPSVEGACLDAPGGARAIVNKGVADAVESLDQALRRPGKSVALVPLAYLDTANGVLDRLKAQGAEISVPGD